MARPLAFRLTGSILLVLMAASCGGDSPSQRLSPTAPAGVAAPAGTTSISQGATAGSVGSDGGRSLALPLEDAAMPSAITFPPRNEPFAFRQDLEAKYRDGLRRSAVQSYVDIEGTIVWTQEYLRYRVNGCDHGEALNRVFRQIDGFGVQPVCVEQQRAVFPPRDEPYDFRVLLEAKYRDALRRLPVQTYVDTEGDIVWTQEYLRYRVSGCLHVDAQQKVFAQIDGRGVAPDCSYGSPMPLAPFVDTVPALDVAGLVLTAPRSGLLQLSLTWTNATVDLDLYLVDIDCSEEQCDILAFSINTAGTFEQVTYPVQQGEEYIVLVDNLSSSAQTFTLSGLIYTSGPSAAGRGSPTFVQVAPLGRGLRLPPGLLRRH